MNNNELCFKPDVWVGIDPGISKSEPGAAALIHPNGHECFDWSNEGKVADNFRIWTSKYNIKIIAIERQWGRPGNSTQNANKIMKNYGFWIGLSCAHGFYDLTIYPTAQEWQKAMLPYHKGVVPKEIYLKEARVQFPNADLKFKKYNGRAAALWIATYARRIDKINVSRIH